MQYCCMTAIPVSKRGTITLPPEIRRALGLEARAEALARARPEAAPRIRRQVERLAAPDQMGELFLAAALHSPGLKPPGFGDTP